jgi:hypothetical protein
MHFSGNETEPVLDAARSLARHTRGVIGFAEPVADSL